MKRVAICPKCEKRHELTPNISEAWCGHRVKQEDGTLSEIVERIPCKIIEVEND